VITAYFVKAQIPARLAPQLLYHPHSGLCCQRFSAGRVAIGARPSLRSRWRDAWRRQLMAVAGAFRIGGWGALAREARGRKGRGFSMSKLPAAKIILSIPKIFPLCHIFWQNVDPGKHCNVIACRGFFHFLVSKSGYSKKRQL